jgi:surface antigen
LKYLALLLLVACGRSQPAGPAPPAATLSASASASAASEHKLELEAQLAELWKMAKDGEGDDLARLARREGSTGLMEKGQADASLRLTALRALAYAPDFVALPWLGHMALTGSSEEAQAALDSAVDLAAQPRKQLDPEDALELKEGCTKLLEVARKGPTERRIPAIRALRMLVDRGCVKKEEIPSDLDAK